MRLWGRSAFQRYMDDAKRMIYSAFQNPLDCGLATESTMRVLRDVFVICFVFILAALCRAQTKSPVSGHTFRNEDISLTWTFPETLVPEVPDRLPRDPSGRERILLALWDNAEKTPVPLIVFLWDTKTRPDTR